MKAAEVIASAGTRKRLGESLEEICGWLWPQDCQTCGQPLSGQRPTLCVDSSSLIVTASLHHPPCRSAEWNESADLVVSRAARLSWTSRTWANLPLVRAGMIPDPRPFLLVNPSLEMVFLVRSGDSWRPELARSFTAAGLLPAGQVYLDRPAGGLTAELSSGTVRVRLTGPPSDTYSSSADDLFAARVRKSGGLLFGVTQLLNPAAPVTPDHMLQLILAKSIWLAWVSLAPAGPPGRGRPAPGRAG